MENDSGCCYTCRGTGGSYDVETNGRCWDCRGTGHAHVLEQSCEGTESNLKYVAKPFEIEAMRYYNDGESFEKIQKWVGTHETPNGHVHPNFDHASNWVMDGENISAVVWDYLHQTWVGARLGDYIIKDMKGEFYPCDPEVFKSKYAPKPVVEVKVNGVVTAEDIKRAVGEAIQQSARFR